MRRIGCSFCGNHEYMHRRVPGGMFHQKCFSPGCRTGFVLSLSLCLCFPVFFSIFIKIVHYFSTIESIVEVPVLAKEAIPEAKKFSSNSS